VISNPGKQMRLLLCLLNTREDRQFMHLFYYLLPETVSISDHGVRLCVKPEKY